MCACHHPPAPKTPNGSDWPRPTPARSPGAAGAPTCPSGRGARCGRTTAPTARPGTPSPTTTPAPAPTAGTRTAWRASATSSRTAASRSRCGTASTRSSRSGCSASPARRATTARTSRSTGGTSTPRRPTRGCAGATTTRRRAFPYDELVEENAGEAEDRPEYELVDTGVFDDDRYWDVTVDYAKAGPTDSCIRITVRERRAGGGDAARAAARSGSATPGRGATRDHEPPQLSSARDAEWSGAARALGPAGPGRRRRPGPRCSATTRPTPRGCAASRARRRTRRTASTTTSSTAPTR